MAFSAWNKDLLDLFDCSICMNFMYPPIFQCPNGHHFCRGCKERINNTCPTCRMGIGDIRSLPLEKVGDAIMFPCRYQETGCSGSFEYDRKQEHEKECEHRPYECPHSPDCIVKGDIKKLVAHLAMDHNIHVERSDEICMNFGFRNESREIYECLSQHFILQYVADYKQMKMCAYISFMGEQSEADNYRYRLEFGNEDQDGKTTWQGIPRSIRKQFQINDHNGLTIHFNEQGPPPRIFKGSIWRKEPLQVISVSSILDHLDIAECSEHKLDTVEPINFGTGSLPGGSRPWPIPGRRRRQIPLEAFENA